MPLKPPLTLQEKEEIKTLLASGLTYHAVAQRVNRDPKTVKSYALQPEAQIGIEEQKQELADKFEDMAHRMLDSVTETDIEKLSAYQRVLSSGIATDKMRLLRDQSTENISIQSVAVHLHQALEQHRAQRQALTDEIQRRGLQATEEVFCLLHSRGG